MEFTTNRNYLGLLTGVTMGLKSLFFFLPGEMSGGSPQEKATGCVRQWIIQLPSGYLA